MTKGKNLTTQPIYTSLLGKRMSLGGGIALVIISVFLLGVQEPLPEWGKLWMVKALIITPLMGAMGGLGTYIMGKILNQNGWKKILGIVLSLIGYIIALWLGIVLGLNGTLWH